MIKKVILTSPLFFLSLSFFAQTFVSIGGSSTSQNETNQMVPTTFNNAKVQVLLRASELTAKGIPSNVYISGISYYISSDKTPGTITADFYADLIASGTTSFPSVTFFATPTLRGNITDAGTINSAWRNVTFSTPFLWDGSSNILIQMCRTSAAMSISDIAGYISTPGYNTSITGYNHTCTATDGYYVQTFRPQIGVTYSTTLPVNWLTFTATTAHNNAHLNWSTASEQNNSHFEIQRSADAVNFATIGSVNASASPNIKNDYSFIDAQPLTGTSFYRLKQVDLDGKFSYSSTIQINGVLNSDFRQWFDGASKKLIVQVPQSFIGVADLSVFDAMGRLILKSSVMPGRNEISCLNAMNGVYYLKISNNNQLLLSGKVVI